MPGIGPNHSSTASDDDMGSSTESEPETEDGYEIDTQSESGAPGAVEHVPDAPAHLDPALWNIPRSDLPGVLTQRFETANKETFLGLLIDVFNYDSAHKVTYDHPYEKVVLRSCRGALHDASTLTLSHHHFRYPVTNDVFVTLVCGDVEATLKAERTGIHYSLETILAPSQASPVLLSDPNPLVSWSWAQLCYKLAYNEVVAATPSFVHDAAC